MARNGPERERGVTRATEGTDRTVDRRSYLKLAGTAAAVLGASTTTASAAPSRKGLENRSEKAGGPRDGGETDEEKTDDGGTETGVEISVTVEDDGNEAVSFEAKLTSDTDERYEGDITFGVGGEVSTERFSVQYDGTFEETIDVDPGEYDWAIVLSNIEDDDGTQYDDVSETGTVEVAERTDDADGAADATISIDHDAAWDPNASYNGAGYTNSGDADELTCPYHIHDHRGGSVGLTQSGPVHSGDTSFRHDRGSNSKTANTQFQFDHHDYSLPEESFWRCWIHPDGFEIHESGTTVRYFWGAIKSGPNSSGGTTMDDVPSGDDGWSVALSFGRRLDTPGDHPNAYGPRAYVYHMDQPYSSGDNFICGDDPDQWIQMDEWNKIEFYHKLNTYENGEAYHDGVFRLWVNDTEVEWHDARGNPRDNTNLRWATTSGQGNQRPGPIMYVLGDVSNDDIYYDDFELWVGDDIPSEYRA